MLTTAHSGELLLDQGRFEEAVEKFDKAIELEQKKYLFYLPHTAASNSSTICSKVPS